jgi:hypothetical protein
MIDPCPFCGNNKPNPYCCRTWQIFCNNLKTGKPNLSNHYVKDGKYVSNGNLERNALEAEKRVK